MSLFSKTESSLGVDIGAGGIKLVELHKVKGRPLLWTYAMADQNLDIHVDTNKDKTAQDLLAEGKGDAKTIIYENKGDEKQLNKNLAGKADPRIDKYANLLKAAAEAAKITTKKVTASLPVSQVFHAIITLPKVSKDEISHHVMAKVKKMLPRPIEEMQVVHQVVPSPPSEKGKSIRVLVTAAPKDLVRFYTSIFQKAGFQLEELETEAFALERCLVGRDKATAMIVDVGAERTNFFIVDQGLPVTHRSIQVGGNHFSTVLEESLGIEKNLTEIVKSDISRLGIGKIPTDLFLNLLDPIIKEIQYSFDLFLSQTGNENKHPEKIILTGGASVFPPIAEIIKENFPLKVFVGDPWARVVYQQGLKSILDSYGPRMAVTIGLALRGMVDNKK